MTVSSPLKVSVLGATGSIGRSTLDVLARHPERYRVHAVTAQRSREALLELCLAWAPARAVIGSAADAEWLRAELGAAGHGATEVSSGEQALVEVAGDPDADVVMAAIVGAAGLLPTLAAVEAGKRVLLANKEALVMSGSLFMQAVARAGATLFTDRFGNNAIYQCLPMQHRGGLERLGVSRLLLTASGGPFREWASADLDSVTPAQACAHPNWSMGQKIGRQCHPDEQGIGADRGVLAVRCRPGPGRGGGPSPASSIRWWATAMVRCWRSWVTPTCVRRSPTAWPGPSVSMPGSRRSTCSRWAARFRAAR